MPALREVFAHFGVKFDDKQLEKGDRAVKETAKDLKGLDRTADRTADTLGDLGRWLAGGAIVAGLAHYVQGFVEATRETNVWANALRLSTQDMMGWQYVASRFGVTTDDLTSSLKDLQVRAQDAVANGGSYAEAFQSIGISMGDIRPIVNDASAVMELFSDRMNATTDSARQLFAVDELLGDAGVRMIPILRQGSQRIREWRREAASTAGRDAPAMSRAVQTLTERGAELNLRWQAIRNTFVLAVAPGLDKLAEKLAPVLSFVERTVPAIIDLTRNSSVLQTALVAAGIAIAVAWGPAVLTAALAYAPFLALFVVAEDLITTFRGGDSIIRRFMDGLLGAERAAEVVRSVQEAMEGVLAATIRAHEAVRGFFGAVEESGLYEDPLHQREAAAGHRAGRSITENLSSRRRLAETVAPPERSYWGDWWGIPRWIGDSMRRVAAGGLSLGADSLTEERGVGQIPQARMSGEISATRGVRPTTVNAPTNVSITVHEATDAEAVAATVRETLVEESGRQLRGIRQALGGTP